jgi:hypothetical protein
VGDEIEWQLYNRFGGHATIMQNRWHARRITPG